MIQGLRDRLLNARNRGMESFASLSNRGSGRCCGTDRTGSNICTKWLDRSAAGQRLANYSASVTKANSAISRVFLRTSPQRSRAQALGFGSIPSIRGGSPGQKNDAADFFGVRSPQTQGFRDDVLAKNLPLPDIGRTRKPNSIRTECSAFIRHTTLKAG
jgi:hypothetical protein